MRERQSDGRDGIKKKWRDKFFSAWREQIDRFCGGRLSFPVAIILIAIYRNPPPPPFLASCNKWLTRRSPLMYFAFQCYGSFVTGRYSPPFLPLKFSQLIQTSNPARLRIGYHAPANDPWHSERSLIFLVSIRNYQFFLFYNSQIILAERNASDFWPEI